MERAWAMVVRRLAAIHLRRHAHLCRLSAVASSCGEKVGNLQRGGRGRLAFLVRSRRWIRTTMVRKNLLKGSSNIHGWIKPPFPYNTFEINTCDV